ncbi:MAG: hypothetical protein ACI9G9_000077 [Psychromonas sp.]
MEIKDWQTEVRFDRQFKYCLRYFISFAILTHICIVSFKRQMNKKRLRVQAFPAAIILSCIVLAGIEILSLALFNERTWQLFWIFSGTIGIFIGVWTFRMLYKNEY